MGLDVREVSQLVVVTPNRIGMSEMIFETLAAEGINVHGMCIYSLGLKGVFRLQTSDDHKAARCLDHSECDVSVENVLMVMAPSRVGVVASISRKLGIAEVDIEYAYGSSHTEEASAIIIKCRDNQRAITALS
jgi:hypothetical protein